jgi:hypothetical protein
MTLTHQMSANMKNADAPPMATKGANLIMVNG